jgi:hypothetical protein
MALIAGEWWFTENGTNNLKGVEGDEDNPILLSDEYIYDFINQIPAARESFFRLLPNMLPLERERLQRIAASAPEVDPRVESDAIMKKWVSAGIHILGPHGIR